MTRGDNPEDCHAPQNDYWLRCHGGDACRASDAARPLDGSLSSLPAPPPLRSLPAPPPLRSLPPPPALCSLPSLPAPPLRSPINIRKRLPVVNGGGEVIAAASHVLPKPIFWEATDLGIRHK